MTKSGFTEMQVDSIRVHMPSGQHVVILKDKAAERYLPIWIGIYEANAIALKITGITPERPITHDLMTNIFGDLGARLTSVEVSSLDSDVFYARIFMAVDGRTLDVDARPSDAIALAVRAEVPILVSDDVLDKGRRHARGRQRGELRVPQRRAHHLQRAGQQHGAARPRQP